jgi:hypothetical protein
VEALDGWAESTSNASGTLSWNESRVNESHEKGEAASHR